MKLYEYAVIYNGKRDKDGEQVDKPELLVFDKVLADSEEQAQIVAARAIPEKHLDHLDRVTIAVRPF